MSLSDHARYIDTSILFELIHLEIRWHLSELSINAKLLRNIIPKGLSQRNIET